MYLKRIMAALTMITVIAAVIPFDAYASTSTVKINATAVDIYGLDTWEESLLSIPSDYNTSFQIKVTGATKVTYSVTSGDSVTVSSTGLVSPVYETWYWHGNYGSSVSSGDEDETVTNEGAYGSSVVTVTADSTTFKVSVNFIDYGDTYTNLVMDEYIEENIDDSMTDYEKLDKVCAFAASYDYSAYYSSARGMIISGGGDCWASTDAIVQMATKIGFDAWFRNGNKDPGSGSGHINAMILSNGVYYECEAGYTGKAPRYYYVKQRDSLYSYSYYGDGIEVYQYDGKEMPETLEIPEYIDGYKVVSIGEKFLLSDDTVKEVVLPDTVENIGKSAFNSCSALKKINIPAACASIGKFVFTNCNKLTDITVDSENSYFSASDGVLYDKDKTTLLYAPALTSLTVPSTVTTIASYSLYYNYNLESLTIPSSVKTIEEGAIGNTALENVNIQGSGLVTIGDYAFCNNYSLKQLSIPSSVTSIGNYSLGMSSSGTVMSGFKLKCYSDSAAVTYAEENEIDYILLDIPGDVDSDGEVNMSDVVSLQRYISKWDITINEDVADVTGDEEIDMSDVVLLQRYISNWDVTLK